MTTTPTALRIAGQLRQTLRARPFSGHVAGRFERACNLVDDAGRVITLATPAIGNGPFFIVLNADANLFETLRPRQPARIDTEQIALGDWRIPLYAARVWDARLPDREWAPRLSPRIAAIVRPYTEWPRLDSDTPVARNMARRLAQGAHTLIEAVKRRASLIEAAWSLAGLGHGLTPAGDDFLLGMMAALWLLGERETLPAIAQAAAARTTTLSAAFLTAAAQGQFIEAWHGLARALHRQDDVGGQAALRRIAAFGGSSGRDALSGFAITLLSHAC
jgi:hypothetical protein